MPSILNTCRLACCLTLIASAGCISPCYKGISVGQLQPCWLAQPKACKRPVDFTLLQRDPTPEHVVMARDVLGVYIEGILSGDEISSGGRELPGVNYPNEGEEQPVQSPAVGQPVLVQNDGALILPMVAPVPVAGQTLQQVADSLRNAYVNKGFLKDDPSKSYVQVTLIKPRVNRVLVIREDVNSPTVGLIRLDTQVLTKRGDAAVVTLAERESDLLHALASTGGLPGEDARNEVWILRGQSAWDMVQQQYEAGSAPCDICASQSRHTVIPLRHRCDQPLPFGRGDVVLQDGDVVFVEKRNEEYFYTGGLLQAGRVPLPRDEDIDILEAVALGNIGLGGPAGINAAATQFRAGPGNIVPPTRALVIRKLAGGQQVMIDVDLRKAVNCPEERILIQPEDMVLLKYRSHELTSNVLLNIVNFSYIIPN